MLQKKTDNLFGIIGLGCFGASLAIKLAEAGKDVIVIDKDEAKVKELREYTEYAYVAQDLTKETLEEAGIHYCDTAIVGIGEKIDTSILLTLNLINLGIQRVIAKAISPDQGMVLERLGAEVIYPERDMALRLAKKILVQDAMEFLRLENDVLVVIGKSKKISQFEGHLAEGVFIKV